METKEKKKSETAKETGNPNAAKQNKGTTEKVTATRKRKPLL